MKLLALTAGAGPMYCGSCLRDNALAAELVRRGHDVILMPLYTPTRTDEPNVSRSRVFLGGISVYLEHKLPIFRHTPKLLDRLWDAPAVIRAMANRPVQTNPRMLGELTVSTLRGEHGAQRKEVEKLCDWLATEPPPDLTILPNSLLISLAAPIRRVTGRPVARDAARRGSVHRGPRRALAQRHDRFDPQADAARRRGVCRQRAVPRAS